MLLLATETGQQEDIVRAIKEIIVACSDVHDVDELPTFDIEFLFLQIRTKSVGESVEVNVICPDDNKTSVQVEIDIDSIKIQKTKGHKNIIKLDDQYSM